MRIRLRLAALLIAALAPVLLLVTPASASSGVPTTVQIIRCTTTQNACELVTTAGPQSRYVEWVAVYDNNSAATHTIRLLFAGQARYAWRGKSFPGHKFVLNYYVDKGRCVQGGIEGVSNARTPCWRAP